MWMAYNEATWPKAVNLRTAVERLQRQFDAIGWDALLNLNRISLTVEECEEVQAIEDRYFDAVEQCEKFLKDIISVDTLKQYLVDAGLDNYVSDIDKFIE